MNISPMPSVNFNNKNSQSFKSNSQMTREEFYEVQAAKERKRLKEQNKVEIGAAVAGLATWGLAALAKAKKPFETGAKGYFAALYALYTLNILTSKDDKVDLGSEEKNKQYQEMLKKECDEEMKYVLIPTAVVGAVFTAITAAVCFIKNTPEKLDTIKTAPLVSMTPTLFASYIALRIKQNNEDKQKEQTKLLTNA